LKADYNLHSASAWSDDHDEIEIGDVPPGHEEEMIEKAMHDPRVKFVSPQHIFRAEGSWEPNDPLLAKQWHMKRVGAIDSWSYATGHGSIVSIVDTGVQQDISDLQGVSFNKGYNFADDNDNTNDGNAHGTHCTGTVANVPNNGIGGVGLAPASTILPVKVLSDQGFGTMAGVAEGIRYAADNNANVISLSLGASQPDPLTKEAVEYAQGRGSLVIAAAGNSGDDHPHYPSNYPGVISVGATDQNDHLARFSTYGHSTLTAPGVAVVQQVPDGSFQAFNGTSMACPHAAALASQLVSLGLRGEAVKDAMVSNVDDRNDEKHFGAGIINASKTVRSVYWHQLAYRLGFLLLGAGLIKRRIRTVGGSPRRPGVVAMLLAGTGLLPFIPLVFTLPKLGSLSILAELGMKPFGMWDLPLLGANFHHWLLLASAIPAVLFALLCYGAKSLRASIGGFAIGASALLAQLTLQNDGGWSMLYRALMLANIGLCLWIARISLDQKSDTVVDYTAPSPIPSSYTPTATVPEPEQEKDVDPSSLN